MPNAWHQPAGMSCRRALALPKCAQSRDGSIVMSPADITDTRRNHQFHHRLTKRNMNKIYDRKKLGSDPLPSLSARNAHLLPIREQPIWRPVIPRNCENLPQYYEGKQMKGKPRLNGDAHYPVARDPFTRTQIRIGVMGSAAIDFDSRVARICQRLGRAIAEQGCCLLTGACPGLPHQVVLGAKEAGGNVIGISPGLSLKEHIETFASPYAEYDVLIYTGLGLMGRELINIRSSDIVVTGGRCGTLGEFSIAYEEGKLIGVLRGTGGITTVLSDVVRSLGKATGAEVIYDAAPEELIRKLLERYQSANYECPCQPARCECQPSQ